MPSRSMICLARTLPTPGIDSSSADTFILPTTSSVWPSLRTWGRDVAPCFSRFFTSARSLRAWAAFASAAARCSGVRGGRATRGHLGFRIEKVAPRGETSEFGPARQRKPPFAPAQIIQIDAPYNSELHSVVVFSLVAQCSGVPCPAANAPACQLVPGHLCPPQRRGDGGSRRAGVSGAGNRAADHEQIRARPERLLRGRHPRLIVAVGARRPDARRDQEDVGADLGSQRRDLLRRADQA